MNTDLYVAKAIITNPPINNVLSDDIQNMGGSHQIYMLARTLKNTVCCGGNNGKQNMLVAGRHPNDTYSSRQPIKVHIP
jgi:hypothetical protein